MQVVIHSRIQDRYLQRRSSYGCASWTTDLQNARVFSYRGALRAINIMDQYYFTDGKRYTGDDFEIVPVKLQIYSQSSISPLEFE